MKKAISKRKVARINNSTKRVPVSEPPLRETTLEEVLERNPFIRKKHEKAVATLKRCPFPEELLLKNKKK